MTPDDGRTAISRRTVLRASGGTLALFGAGVASASGDEASDDSVDCSDTTARPSMVHYDHSWKDACVDDHPKTEQLHEEVKTALDDRFSTVGALIDSGFVPYFDFLAADEGAGWSHWLNPDFLDDDSVVEPTRPESVLVDHRWWRPIGVMFIATRDGERVDPPPTVYGGDGERGGGGERQDGDESARGCLPWHAHVGLPGRYSWWKYQKLYAQGLLEDGLGLPCRTPWMMHVWAYPHPESVYAHDAPPRGSRGGPPAEDAGFETDAVPGEDELGPDVLPDAFRHRLEHLS